MDKYEYYEYITLCLAKLCTTGARLYKGNRCLYYYAMYELDVDMAEPYLDKILESEYTVGIFTNPLLQFYALITLDAEFRVIIGPSRALVDKGPELEELLNQLGLEGEERDKYVKIIYSLPAIHVNRLIWHLVYMQTVLQGEPFLEEDVWVEPAIKSVYASSQEAYMDNIIDVGEDIAIKQTADWEEMIFSYVEEGKMKRIQQIFQSPPKIFTACHGTMKEKLKNTKRRGVYFANRLSKLAIRRGLSPQKAQVLLEMYQQKIENIQDYMAGNQLVIDMIVDFTGQIEQLMYAEQNISFLGQECIRYISDHVYETIQSENMASDLGYSRPYLCTKFKKEMNMSLTEYIQKAKIEEGFMDYDLSKIANMLSFSSQSYFQTVFKKITGETPMEYRNRKKRTENQMEKRMK